MADLKTILRCPTTGRDLEWTPEGQLAAKDGPTYLYRDGVAHLIPGDDLNYASKDIQKFYEERGWGADDEGQFDDTKVFTDTRAVSIDFSNRCMRRTGRHFSKGGEYLLDAGSGAIPHDELVRFGDKFQKRVCLDLSVQGLKAAKRKLGDRGLYLQGDLTNLPLKTGSMDAVTCNHVLYQIAPELQLKSLHEIWRVLKPGGVAAIVYVWPTMKLDWRLGKIARRIFGMRVPQPPPSDAPEQAAVEIPHHPLPEEWFHAQNFPFKFKMDTFRLVSQHFLKTNVTDDWRGRAFVNALFAAQVLAPGYCGKYGAVPTIVIRKPKDWVEPASPQIT